MSWFKKTHFGFKIQRQRERETPDGLWRKCDGCGEILYVKDLERNLLVCSKCNYHFRIGAREYIVLLTDPDSFEELFTAITATDPLNFRDTKRYVDRLKDNRRESGLEESVIAGRARILGHAVAIAVMDFAFLGGTLGSATGEKIRRTISLALQERIPLLIVSTSGGARMQEGILSLMQMAKTSVVLADLMDQGIPYVSILLNPTTAGVAASFAALGDIIISEPGAMIGFAGPRVIQQTINQELPPGFQRAEFVLDHGMIDMIVSRRDMRERVGEILDLLMEPRRTMARRPSASAVSEGSQAPAPSPGAPAGSASGSAPGSVDAPGPANAPGSANPSGSANAPGSTNPSGSANAPGPANAPGSAAPATLPSSTPSPLAPHPAAADPRGRG